MFRNRLNPHNQVLVTVEEALAVEAGGPRVLVEAGGYHVAVVVP
jgi:hypothetical protein